MQEPHVESTRPSGSTLTSTSQTGERPCGSGFIFLETLNLKSTTLDNILKNKLVCCQLYGIYHAHIKPCQWCHDVTGGCDGCALPQRACAAPLPAATSP